MDGLLGFLNLSILQVIPCVGFDGLAIDLDALHTEDVVIFVALGEDKPAADCAFGFGVSACDNRNTFLSADTC